MELPELDPESLWLFVFGPGVGELVAVRAPPPPGRWMIVDGCRANRASYAQKLLRHYEAEPDIIVLTHPHQDHAAGIADLVEEHTPRDDRERWPLIGMVEPPDTYGPRPDRDPQGAYDANVSERAVSTIRSRWEANADCRWTMGVGDQRNLGDATVAVLSPEDRARKKAFEAHERGKRVPWNEVATALLVTWAQNRIVLGSDLVERPGAGWTAALRRRSDLPIHRALKVPHHASRSALQQQVLSSGSRLVAPVWIVTSYASCNLPRLDTGPEGGIAYLHKHHPEIHLTSPPRGYDDQGGPAGNRFTRSQLARAMAKGLSFDPRRPGFPDCFVAVTFDRAGRTAVRHGACSVVVTKSRARTMRRRPGG